MLMMVLFQYVRGIWSWLQAPEWARRQSAQIMGYMAASAKAGQIWATVTVSGSRIWKYRADYSRHHKLSPVFQAWSWQWWLHKLGVVRRRWASFLTGALTSLIYVPLSIYNMEATRQTLWIETAFGVALWVLWFVLNVALWIRQKRMVTVNTPEFDDDMTMMMTGVVVLPIGLPLLAMGIVTLFVLGVGPVSIGLVGFSLWAMMASTLVGIIGLLTSGLRLTGAALKPLIIGA